MSTAFAGELCPQATQRLQRAVLYGNLKERVAAPSSSQEARQRLSELDTLSGDRRTAAVMALGLGGNLEAFERFVAARAGDDLFIYASNYLNADGTVCVDPAIEQEIIEHLGDAELDRGLLAFLYRNRYRSRELLAVLLAVPLDPERPRDYLPRARALTATNLPGIEAAVLKRAQSLPDPETAVLRYVLPDVHRHLIEFFGARAYVPALAYLRGRLAASPRDEVEINLRNGNANTRLAVYRAMERIGGESAAAALLDELAAMTQADWDDYFSSELYDLGPMSLRAATTPAQRARAVAALRGILARPSLPGHPGYLPPDPAPAGEPGYYDYQVRKEVYALLPAAADAGAGDVLADELARVTASPVATNRDALVIHLVEAVRQWPTGAALDAPRLARLSGAIDNEISAVSLLGALYGSRPSAAVVAAIVQRLDRLDASYANDPRLAGPLRDELYNLALRARDHSLALALRLRLDHRFEVGDMAREEYRRWSLAFNSVLGDETESYRATERALQAEREQVPERR